MKNTYSLCNPEFLKLRNLLVLYFYDVLILIGSEPNVYRCVPKDSEKCGKNFEIISRDHYSVARNKMCFSLNCIRVFTCFNFRHVLFHQCGDWRS